MSDLTFDGKGGILSNEVLSAKIRELKEKRRSKVKLTMDESRLLSRLIKMYSQRQFRARQKSKKDEFK